MAMASVGSMNQMMARSYGANSQAVYDVLASYVATQPAVVGSVSSQMITQLDADYERFNGAAAREEINAVMRDHTSMWDDNVIRYLNTPEYLQAPPQAMVRYIMANPEFATAYADGRMSGYGDRYQPLDPENIGADNYDYQNVMHGMVEITESGEWSAAAYIGDMIEGDSELYFRDQVDIIRTWDFARTMYDEDNDFSAE